MRFGGADPVRGPDRAADLVRSGMPPPVRVPAGEVPPARDAATVILLRDAPGGPEVFLQRRAAGMKFAPGRYVFPGGRVEPADAAPGVPVRSADRADPFQRAVGAGRTAGFRALAVAAVRETWEESGVLLAVPGVGAAPDPAGPPPGADLPDWLQQSGWEIDAAALLPWAHWVTPESEPYRYDTRFLVTGLPDGQDAHQASTESSASCWCTPAAVLDAVAAGQLSMLPPTTAALGELREFASVAGALASAHDRTPDPILPRPVGTAGGRTGNGRDGRRWAFVHAYTGEVLDRW